MTEKWAIEIYLPSEENISSQRGTCREIAVNKDSINYGTLLFFVHGKPVPIQVVTAASTFMNHHDPPMGRLVLHVTVLIIRLLIVWHKL